MSDQERVSRAPDVSLMRDEYAPIAEFYDLMMGSFPDRLAALAAALAAARPSEGPILDLGAGTGLTVATIAATLPGARIVAVEPSAAMRAALLARLAASDDLRARVTVLPGNLSAVTLPDRLGGAVLLGVVGHLDPARRALLWRELAARLAPGAPAVVELQPPHRPEPVPRTRYARVPVGDHIYEGWNEAAPAGRGRLRWTMTYRVLRGDALVQERVTMFDYDTLTTEDLAAEAAPAGLAAEAAGDDLVVLRHAAGAAADRARPSASPATPREPFGDET